MALAYEAVLGEYRHRDALKYLKGKFDPNSRTAKSFRAAALLANSIGADYEEFCRAQFFWIHKWFGRAAYPSELRSKEGKFPATDRYQKYLKLRNCNDAPSRVESIVTRSEPISNSELDKINRRRLEELMDLWGLSAIDAIESFAADGMFDTKWLIKQPEYKQLRAENRI